MREKETKSDAAANVGEMRKRREKMADGRRYIIYYTFGENEKPKAEITAKSAEENENV
jgi:hypothetical protein